MRNSLKRTHARSVSACALIFGTALLLSTATFAKDTTVKFDIPVETTAKALSDFSKQSGLQILFPYDVAAKTTAPEVKGAYSTREALAQILVGSGLEIASENGSTISLRIVGKPAPVAGAEPPTEVIVTGTHLRGGNPTSPVHTLTRKDIDQSGYSQIGDVMRSLPETFSGGQNPGVVSASTANIGNQNISNASTINLRGLGTDATLVLLNGHRLSADSFFQGVDISGIPLSALQRIEVVTDGASATYGSDAVAGVANMITRKNYNGVEVSVRTGSATQGGGREQTDTVLVGIARTGWYAMLNYEYSKQGEIRASQRAFTAAAPPQETFLQPQTRNSLFISAGANLSSHSQLSFDGIVSSRDSQSTTQYTQASAQSTSAIYTPNYSAALDLKVELPQHWDVHVTTVASGSRNSSHWSYPAYNLSGLTSYKNDLQYVEATANGRLLTLPSGDIKAAFGTGYREEGYQYGLPNKSGVFAASRHVSYLYGETLVPVVAPSVQRLGLNALDLSLSIRTETYSDFGSSTNPKIGIRYVPMSDLTLRATWGTSFKAPSFTQTSSASEAYLYPSASLGYAGGGTAIMTYGGNPDLKPEKSKSWTVGGEFTPSSRPGLTLSATYFNIDYTDRIVQPVANRSAGLSNPLYSPFVELSPSAQRQADLIAASDGFYNYTGSAYNPSSVVAILQNTYTNATAQRISGTDLAYRQRLDLDHSALTLFANGTWLRLKQQTISTAPTTVLTGTIYNPPGFKARGGLAWDIGGLSFAGTVNYLDGETDTGVTPHKAVASWTTVDANVSYKVANADSRLSGVRISLAISNLFDRDPPRAASPALLNEGLSFDSTNASIIGRFVSLSLSKAW